MIVDTLAKGLVDTEKIEKRIEKQIKVSKAKKTKSPPKRGARGRPQRRQHVFEDIDLDLTDSDLDNEPVMSLTTSRSPRRAPRQAPRDPNTIYLDCDDEFIGGPAVAFSRNLAEADAISVEDSQGLKVNVKIHNKIEQYSMNPVS